MNFDLLGLVYLIVAFIIAITLHEAAHAYASDRLGDDTARNEGRLSLNPLVHADPYMTFLLPAFLIIVPTLLTGHPSPVIFGAAKPVPFNPHRVRWGKWGAALVAFAGPLTNLLIAILLSIYVAVVGLSGGYSELIIRIIVINVALFVFNMIPFPPLDGSRLVYAAVPAVRDLFDQIERTGFVAIVFFMFIGYQFIAGFVGSITAAIINILVPGLTQL